MSKRYKVQPNNNDDASSIWRYGSMNETFAFYLNINQRTEVKNESNKTYRIP